jgi:hypothetical protein
MKNIIGKGGLYLRLRVLGSPMVRTLSVVCLLGMLAHGVAVGDEYSGAAKNWVIAPVEADQIVNQKPLEFGCGIASVLNALRFGKPANRRAAQALKGKTDAERMQELIDTYGANPSADFGNGTRFRKDGIAGHDLRDLYNELRSDHGLVPLSGNYLDRQKDETPQQLAVRVHKLLLHSLREGEPPIIHLRSQAAQWNEVKKEFVWEGICGHILTVVAIPEHPNPDGGFELGYVDSQSGAKGCLFAYAEVRNFVAQKGNTERFEWLPDKPFLAVSSPALLLNTQKQAWQARTLIYLHYGIYKE